MVALAPWVARVNARVTSWIEELRALSAACALVCASVRFDWICVLRARFERSCNNPSIWSGSSDGTVIRSPEETCWLAWAACCSTCPSSVMNTCADPCKREIISSYHQVATAGLSMLIRFEVISSSTLRYFELAS